MLFITGRNEVVAKVMFLHVCVILFTGRVSGQGEPPRAGRAPRAGRPPLRQGEPPWVGRPPWAGRTPRAGRTPPGTRPPPPGKQTPAYGLRAAGMHPTGMHSCYIVFTYLSGPNKLLVHFNTTKEENPIVTLTTHTSHWKSTCSWKWFTWWLHL